MRVRNSLQIVSIKSVDRSFLILGILTTFFLGGSFYGFRFSEFCTTNPQTDIAEYLIDFCIIAKSAPLNTSFFRTLVLFFSYPLAVVLAGISPLGVVLIPVLSFCLGFGTLFTIQCFLYTFSRAGIYPVLALLSIRLIIILFCFLFLAVEMLPQAWRIAQVTIRNRKFCESVYHGRRVAVLTLFCSVLLISGVCCEKLLIPTLFRLALKKIFST